MALRLLADGTGLTGELSKALTRASFTPVHDRGRVLVDVAVTLGMLADGGEAIADIDVLRHQDQVLGPVAAAPTVWRTLSELRPAGLKRVESARPAGPAAGSGACCPRSPPPPSPALTSLVSSCSTSTPRW
jgi:hypothetical protein